MRSVATENLLWVTYFSLQVRRVMVSNIKPASKSKDVLWSIVPLLLASKALGLAPAILNHTSGLRKLRNSYYGLVQVALMITSLIILYTLFLIEKIAIYSNNEERPSTQAIVNTVQLTFDVALVVLLITLSWPHVKTLSKFLQEINRVDRGLIALGVSPNHKKTRRFINIQLLASFALFMCNFFMTVGVVYSSTGVASHLILHWVLYNATKTIVFLFVLQSVNLLLILNERFNIINDHLSRFSSCLKKEGNIMENIDCEYKQNMIFNLKPKKPIQFISKRDVASNSGALSRIQALLSLHTRLLDQAEDINNALSLRMLAMITSSFIGVTTEANYLMTSWFRAPLPWHQILHSVFLLSVTLAQVALIAIVSDVTSTKGNKSAVISHLILTATTNSEGIKEELLMFSLQLVHRKLQFTALDFFPLDATIMFAIVSGVTTYLVILLQVQMGDTT